MGCIMLRTRGKHGFEETSMSEDVGMGTGDSQPPATLLQMMTGYWVSQALYVAAKLGIADLLADGRSTARTWQRPPTPMPHRSSACCGRSPASVSSRKCPQVPSSSPP
jgi:hypothetical protein